MIGNVKIIIEKINYFYTQQCKVHITKHPTSKFPKGKFLNGKIGQVYSDKIIFDDDVDGVDEVFFSEISDIDKYREDNPKK